MIRSMWLLMLPMSLILVACPRRTAVRLGEDSTANQPVFLLGSERGKQERVEIGLFRVDSCASLEGGTYPRAERADWHIEAKGEVAVSRIVYGTLPPGFHEIAPAAPLAPNTCYMVTVTGSGTVRFEISDGGQLHEVSVP